MSATRNNHHHYQQQHVERFFIKIIFEENNFHSIIDVLSLPVLSTVLSALEFVKFIPINAGRQRQLVNPYTQYEHPIAHIKENKAADFSTSCQQYELFEFAIEHKNTAAVDQKASRKRRKYNNMDNDVGTIGDDIFLSFQQSISWAILKNFQQLVSMTKSEDRYCYVDGSVSNMDLCEEGVSYMKIFSRRNKLQHILNLNYRNKFSIYNHMNVYFNVANFYKFELNKSFFRINVNMLQDEDYGNDADTEEDTIVDDNNNNNNKMYSLHHYNSSNNNDESMC